MQWLVDHSEIVWVEVDKPLYQNGDAVDHLFIILEGRLRMFVNRNNQHRELGFNEKGYVGGLLPYSRLKTAVATAVAVEPTTVLRLHRREFTDMICSQFNLVECFVHMMLDRIRDFTKLDQQNEKMISLGKLSAGLAHELNNPAAAVVRSASALKKHLGFVPEKFKAVISVQMNAEQIDQVAGPYFVSGGWWHSLVHREYYFAQICAGDLLWIYYDRPRRQWRWQGQVE